MPAQMEMPRPRQGILGLLDRFIGPGATPGEIALQFTLPFAAGGAAVIYAIYAIGTWSTAQYIICAILALDLVGGIITNSTASGKRWYHRAGQSVLHHFGFVSLHLAHLALVWWLYAGSGISWLVISGAYLMMAGLVILKSQTYLQRPVALIMFAGSLILSQYGLESPQGMEWFLPLFYLKLLVSHLPKE